METRKYNFVGASTEENSDRYNPPEKVTKFYQICTYPTKLNTYFVRQILYDEYQQMVKVTEKALTYGFTSRLMEKLLDNEYRTYPTNDLKYVDYPNPDECLKSQSELLGNCASGGFGNFAKF